MEKAPIIRTRNQKAKVTKVSTEVAPSSESEQWVELKPYGLAMTADGSRPLMLLKNEGLDLSLPIPINHWEAGMTLTHGGAVQHHRAFEVLLNSFHVKMTRCHFVRVRPPHLLVHLFVENHPSTTYLELRAEEAMSLCLHFNIPIFATKSFIVESKQFVSTLQVQQLEILNQPQILQKNHTYLM